MGALVIGDVARAWQRRGPLVFAVAAAAITCAGLLALQLDAAGPLLWQLKKVTSASVAAATPLVGISAIADGAYVRFSGTWIQIIDECTGIYAAVLLVAFLLAYPLSLRRRALALVAALATVYLLNLVRLVVLALLMVRAPATADFVHDYVWQVIWAGALVVFAHRVVRARPATT